MLEEVGMGLECDEEKRQKRLKWFMADVTSGVAMETGCFYASSSSSLI